MDLDALTEGLAALTWGTAVMMGVGCLLVALAVIKKYEPLLLLPIGFGCIMANLRPSNESGADAGALRRRHRDELFPLLIFVGVGAMIDFYPAVGATEDDPAGSRRAVRHLRDTAARLVDWVSR